MNMHTLRRLAKGWAKDEIKDDPELVDRFADWYMHHGDVFVPLEDEFERFGRETDKDDYYEQGR